MSNHSEVTQGSDSGCGATGHDADALERVRAAEPDAVTVERMVAIFSAFSDATRVRILYALSLGPMCVCDLADIAGISQSGVSHQLRLLRDRGLVTSKREGQRVMYELDDHHVSELLAQGLAHAQEERS